MFMAGAPKARTGHKEAEESQGQTTWPKWYWLKGHKDGKVNSGVPPGGPGPIQITWQGTRKERGPGPGENNGGSGRVPSTGVRWKSGKVPRDPGSWGCPGRSLENSLAWRPVNLQFGSPRFQLGTRGLDSPGDFSLPRASPLNKLGDPPFGCRPGVLY